MNNLLRAEFYKLRKAKVVYVCTLIMLVLVVFQYGCFIMVDKTQRENGAMGVTVTVENEDTDENVQELAESGVPSIWDGISLLDIEGQSLSYGCIIIAIFVVLEYGNGAIKNVVGKGYAKWKIFLAKYISTTVCGIAMMIVMAVASLIAWILIRGTNGMDSVFFQNLLRYTGLQLLLTTAMIGIMIAFDELCRNLGAGVSINIGIVIFSTLISEGLDLFFKLLFGEGSFQPSRYWIQDLMSNCPLTEVDNDFIIRTFGSSFFWIVAAIAIGILHFRKADIK